MTTNLWIKCADRAAPQNGTEFWGWLGDSGIRFLRLGTAEEWATRSVSRSTNPDDYVSCYVEVDNETEVWHPKYWCPKEAIPEPEQ